MDYIKKAIWGPDPKEQVCDDMIFSYRDETNKVLDEEDQSITP